MDLSPPVFDSLQAYKRALRDVSVWMPTLQAIAERHDLKFDRARVESGVGSTYPTFLVGDVVLKLFGHLRQWRHAYEAEFAAMRLVAQDPSLAVPRLIGSGELFELPSPAWPYLVTSRVSGLAWGEARLSADDKMRVAAHLGVQLAKLGALHGGGVHLAPPAGAPSLTAAAQRSSLPQHLVAQVGAFAARVQASSGKPGQQRFVHGDLMFRHVFVERGRLSGLIDWGDALLIDPHYELVQVQLNLFDCEPGLMQALLQAAQWSPGDDFAQRCLLMALHRQAHGLAQHFSMDVFYKLPQWIDGQRVASLDELARILFAR